MKERMQINSLIEKLKLNKNQGNVYIVLLQMGAGSIQEIAHKSGVKRTTVYSILDALIQRGLVNVAQKGAHREYFAENPKKILNLLDQEEAAIKEQKQAIHEMMPELTSFFNAHATKPKIRMYEGIDGIKQVFNETLLLPRGSETLAYASYQTIHGYLKDWIRTYINRRAKLGITQRCIAEDSFESRENLTKNDQKDLRETRLVDHSKFPFDCDQINIFGNKIFIASYKDLLAVVIESTAIATSMKTIFELAWAGAKQFQEK